MAFNAGSVKATLKLDRKGFKRDLKRAGGDAKKFKLDMGKLFKAGLFGAGLTIAARQIFRFTAESAKIVDAAKAFENIAEVAGFSSDSVVKDVRKITRALSNRQIILAANQLEILGVGMENLPRFVEIARSAAIGLGQDVGFMLQSLTTGTARQSRLLLDNLGIIISIGEANEEYAKKLGVTTKSLDDQQQRLAFLNAMMLRGQDIIDIVGAKSETASEQVSSLGASWSNLTDNFRTFLVDTVNLPGFLGKVAHAIQAITDAQKENATFHKQLQERGARFWVDPLTGRVFGDVSPPIGGGAGQGGGMGVAALNRLGGPTGPRATTGGGGGADRAAQAAVAAQAAAKAYFDNLLRGQGRRSTLGVPLPTGATGGSPGIDQAIPDDPGGITQSMDEVANSTNAAFEAVSGLGDAFGNLTEAMLTGGDAGRVFAASMLSTLSGVMSHLGTLYIQAGIGMLGLATLSPFATIAAGIALKAAAGLFRGGAILNAPSARSPRALRTPLDTTGEAGGSVVNIHVDNFVGNKAWLDAFMREINKLQRNNGNLEVFFQGA